MRGVRTAVNLEFKAKVSDLGALEKIFEEHGAALDSVLNQSDTYFHVGKGRLKFREPEGRSPELIRYQRDEDSSASMKSEYEVLPVTDPSIKGLLSRSLGVKVIVEKERRLLRLKNARIHLDRVKGLGQFLEFEVVSAGDDAGDEELLETLKKIARPFVVEEVNQSYSDLMIRKTSPGKDLGS